VTRSNISTEIEYFIEPREMHTANNKKILSMSSSILSSENLRILMVSPEYPPINGGVGRYTYNLVNELKRQGLDVYVACIINTKMQLKGLKKT